MASRAERLGSFTWQSGKGDRKPRKDSWEGGLYSDSILTPVKVRNPGVLRRDNTEVG